MKHQSASPGLLKAEQICVSKMLITLEEKVVPEHTALLVIDIQNDFCHGEGVQGKRGFDTSEVQGMVPRLLKFLSEARQYHPSIIHVCHLYNEWSISTVWMERQMKFPEHLRLLCVEGTWGAEFYQILPKAGDCIVTKHRYSAFPGTDLEVILKSRGIKTLILTGVATPVCVESTARDGFMKDFFIVIVKDCVAARSVEEHNAALSIMSKHFGKIATSEEIVSAWAKQVKN
ncbi:cysteine hydrolase family protein [Chloroflexota bacterium]